MDQCEFIRTEGDANLWQQHLGLLQLFNDSSIIAQRSLAVIEASCLYGVTVGVSVCLLNNFNSENAKNARITKFSQYSVHHGLTFLLLKSTLM